MDNETIYTLLTNSGLKVFDIDSDFIYFEDPSCIFPAFDTLLEYAWFAIMVLLAIMIFGWALLYIKNGIKINTVFNNAKTVILVLCILGAVKPIVNLVYGENLFGRQCEIKQVSIDAVNELLKLRDKKLVNEDNIVDSNDSETPSVDDAQDDLTKDEIKIIDEESESTGLTESDVVAVESGKGFVIYVKKDGTRIKRSGGSVAWRNNNPGNIKKSEFAFKNGAVGAAGKFAVFPSEEIGLRATMNLLRSKNYVSLSLRQVYDRWAPASDGNNPESYANRVSKMSGVPLSKKIQDLNDDELMRVARAMQVVEGWTVGQEQKI